MTGKAIRIVDKKPELVTLDRVADVAEGHVRVEVVSSSICGSDLHMIEMGIVEGLILGHEFAGRTPNGTAVAIEPLQHCGACVMCEDGLRGLCPDHALLGIRLDGGMATEVVVPSSMLVEVPRGVDLKNASLVEPLAVATHAVRRADLASGERVAVIGAGPIGLACTAVLAAVGFDSDSSARHPHQQDAAARLGASLDVSDGYDVVIDAVGSSKSVRQAIRILRPRGRLIMVAAFWEPVSIDMGILMKEVDFFSAMGYGGIAPDRDFDMAARILGENPTIADALVTHRFPLDGATEAFATAADRAAGAIKVVFDVSN